MHVWRKAVLGLILLVITGGVFAGLLVTGAIGQGGSSGPSAEKLAFEEAERQREEAAQNAPRAPKIPEASAGVPSCPIDLAALTLGVHESSKDWPLFTVPPFRAISPINMATLISTLGAPYDIYAGGLVDDQQQGVLIVAQGEMDPCAVAAGLAPRPEPIMYETPSRSGAVTLTGVQGDTVLFTTPDGATGRFDYTTGQFVAQPSAP